MSDATDEGQSPFSLPAEYTFCDAIGYEVRLHSSTEADAQSQLLDLVAEYFPDRDASEWKLIAGGQPE